MTTKNKALSIGEWIHGEDGVQPSELNTLLCAIYEPAKTGLNLDDDVLIELYNALREELIERKVLSA